MPKINFLSNLHFFYSICKSFSLSLRFKKSKKFRSLAALARDIDEENEFPYNFHFFYSIYKVFSLSLRFKKSKKFRSLAALARDVDEENEFPYNF